MNYTITIEETNTKSSSLEADSIKEASKLAETKYKTGELVLDPGECQYRQIAIASPNGDSTNWQDF